MASSMSSGKLSNANEAKMAKGCSFGDLEMPTMMGAGGGRVTRQDTETAVCPLIHSQMDWLSENTFFSSAVQEYHKPYVERGGGRIVK